MSHPLVATDGRQSNNGEQACFRHNTSKHMMSCAPTAQVGEVPAVGCHRLQQQQQLSTGLNTASLWLGAAASGGSRCDR